MSLISQFFQPLQWAIGQIIQFFTSDYNSILNTVSAGLTRTFASWGHSLAGFGPWGPAATVVSLAMGFGICYGILAVTDAARTVEGY